jgi:hypothetical protein
MVLLALGMIGVGVYVLALGQLSSSGKACGGSPLPVFMNGASPSADRLGQAGDCDREAWESVALGLSTIGIGAVMGVAAVALR